MMKLMLHVALLFGDLVCRGRLGRWCCRLIPLITVCLNRDQAGKDNQEDAEAGQNSAVAEIGQEPANMYFVARWPECVFHGEHLTSIRNF